MSKTLIAVVIVAAVIVGGYFALKSKPADNVSVQNEETSGESSGKKMAFGDLIKQGDSYKCEVKQYVSDFENTGTVYMSGGDSLRGEFTTIAEGRTMESYFIMKDGYMYNWSSFAPNTGVKIKADMSAQAEAEGTYTWSADQIGDYNCEPWAADASKFTLPAGVTFTAVGPQ